MLLLPKFNAFLQSCAGDNFSEGYLQPKTRSLPLQPPQKNKNNTYIDTYTNAQYQEMSNLQIKGENSVLSPEKRVKDGIVGKL